MSDEEIIAEMTEYMISIGWSRPKATTQARMWVDFIAPRVRGDKPRKGV